MKRLPNPVNEKSLYHYCSELQGKIMDGETDVPEGMKTMTAVKLLTSMSSIYVAELKRWQLAQNKELHNLKSDIKTIEIKNYDNIPIEENIKSADEVKPEEDKPQIPEIKIE